MDTKLLTVKEASMILNVKESWLRSQIFRGEIPFIKLGRLLRFDELELKVWLKNKKTNREASQ